jgi:hypothetical protein
MQFPSILMTLAAAQAILGVAAAVTVTPRTPETFTLSVEVPVIPDDGMGYLVSLAPKPGTNPTTNNSSGSLEKRGSGCQACQW